MIMGQEKGKSTYSVYPRNASISVRPVTCVQNLNRFSAMQLSILSSYY